jgi:nucleoside-diphosphate-sugar epimerase
MLSSHDGLVNHDILKANVVGGSGFIGTCLCKRFARIGIDFFITDKNESVEFGAKTKVVDITNLEMLRGAIHNNSIIINLAAEHRDNVSPLSLYNDVNVLGARNLCAAATESGATKIIFTSSVAVYGFAPIGTNESGAIDPFNDYGRTKWEAEQVYKEWQAKDPKNRTLVIVRPTVVFGESNRGNVFNLLRQIASGRFVMIGDGLNRKSMAYVENVAAFLQHSLDFKPGIHIYNYIDKPDFTMNALVAHVNKLLGKSAEIKFRLPLPFGLLIGFCFDVVAKVTGKNFPISAIRVKKFCANSVYDSAIESTGFVPPVPLMEAIEKTVRFEFIEDHRGEQVFYSE